MNRIKSFLPVLFFVFISLGAGIAQQCLAALDLNADEAQSIARIQGPFNKLS